MSIFKSLPITASWSDKNLFLIKFSTQNYWMHSLAWLIVNCSSEFCSKHSLTKKNYKKSIQFEIKKKVNSPKPGISNIPMKCSASKLCCDWMELLIFIRIHVCTFTYKNFTCASLARFAWETSNFILFLKKYSQKIVT